MIWGVISGKGAGELYFVENTMRQDQYVTVLETKLLPQIMSWFGRRGEYTFMQDGAPCHTAKSVKEFLVKKKIPLLDWPGNSPDLNPIENVWSVLKMELAKENITTKAQLKDLIELTWKNNELVKKTIVNSINSMPRRIQAVIKHRGKWTKY